VRVVYFSLFKSKTSKLQTEISNYKSQPASSIFWMRLSCARDVPHSLPTECHNCTRNATLQLPQKLF